MTTVVNGRPRYFAPGTDITVRVLPQRGGYDDVLLEVKGGYLENRSSDGTFLLGSKHPTATDDEHDSAYVAYIEGAGLQWTGQLGNRHSFTAVILKARFYTEDPEPEDVGDCGYDCDEPHGHLPFTPPYQKWLPGIYRIEVVHGKDED